MGDSYWPEIRAIYAEHNPAKLKVWPYLVNKYSGSEAALLARLQARYQMNSVVLGLDCGGVMTIEGGARREGFEAMTCECLAYLSLHVHRWGPRSLCVVSRTKKTDSPETHWVYKTLDSVGFFDVLGVPRKNVRLCRRRRGEDGKGLHAAAFQVIHFIDDRMECLWSVCDDSVNARSSLLAKNSLMLMGRQYCQPTGMDERATRARLCTVQGFGDVAEQMGFSRDEWNGAKQIIGRPLDKICFANVHKVA